MCPSNVVQKAGEEGVGAGFRTYAPDPRQERQGPSLPAPQERPVEGWREDSRGAPWQGQPPAEVSSMDAPMLHDSVRLLYSCESRQGPRVHVGGGFTS